jgi:hypothetical protein
VKSPSLVSISFPAGKGYGGARKASLPNRLKTEPDRD